MRSFDPRRSLAIPLIALLPLFRLSHQSFWFDELFTVWVARHAPGEIVRQASDDGFTPPLFYLLVGLLWRAGVRSEALRILSVVAAALLLWGLARLAQRLGGARARAAVLLLALTSPFLLGAAQELRPYTAYLACAAWTVEALLAWRADPRWRRALAWGALLLLSAAFSYLGLALLPLALAAAALGPARRQGLGVAAAVTALALLISLPGLTKARLLHRHRREAGRVRFEDRALQPLARLLLGPGVRHEPLADAAERRLASWAETSGRAVLVLALGTAALRRHRPLAATAFALALAIGAVWTADALLGIGVTTRYLSLALIPFLLLAALTVAALGRAGLAPLALLASLQAVAAQRYLFEQDCFRDDWRGVLSRLSRLHAPGDVVLGFPGHHLAVAADLYAPKMEVTGGFSGRRGEPVYLFKEGSRFSGYDLEGQLRLVEDLPREVRSLSRGSRLFLIAYEDDEWHGDVRPVVEALGGEAAASTERFHAREVLVLRRFEAAW